eukprot:CAMPEP_0202496732 /NCGR_PEP_ID=MMETSP1361-20130828/20794_1 /ASSEMBLY_ACC=CAM_ASM_000849 /TAXON_ID=210615 /ORGANISM="Staurosira complex sp., Strain CCMP2646" /LENGTH=225 /DNA_ID=CAMNT_0049128137 /DNA_START=80 /DNA_END=757 /DNA_ORIENTATION=+
MLTTIRERHAKELQAMQERFPEADIYDLVKFLQARNFNIEKAANMYQAHLGWRSDTLPILFDSVKDTLDTRKFYLLENTDAEGHPVLFYCLHRFKEAPYNVEDEIKALIYLLENDVRAKMGDSFTTQQWTVLIDVSGIRSPPLVFLNRMNTVMEANYPESLFRTVMFPVPGWLQKIIQGFLLFVDETTRNKFVYANDIKSLEEFAMMPKEQLGPDIAQLQEDNKL